MAILAVGLAVLSSWLLRTFVPHQELILFFAAVIVVAVYGGMRAALLAILLSVFLQDFLFDQTPFHLDLNLTDIEQAIIFALTAAIVSRLSSARNLMLSRLSRKNAELQAIFDHIPVMLTYIGEDGRFKLVNREWERLLGWSQEEARNPDLDILAECYPDPEYRGYVLDSISSSKTKWADFRTRTRHGNTIDTMWANVRLSDGTSIGIGQDVTNRKHAERALREAERKYRDIFENARDGIFQTTPDGQFITANSALAKMLGFDSPAELIAARTDIAREHYVNPQRREKFKQLLNAQGFLANFESEAFKKDGSKTWISENVRAVRDQNGAVLYFEGTTQDITERKRAEARSAAFASLARKLSGARTQLDAGIIIAQTARGLFGWDACNLDLYDAETDRIQPMLNVDTIDGELVDFTPSVETCTPTPRGRRVIEDGPQLTLRTDPLRFERGDVPFGDQTRPSASIMAVPVRHSARVTGLFSIQSYSPRAYDEAALKDLAALADHCGEALNRIRAEQSLRESEERFRQMAEHFEDVIWITDKNLENVLYINPAYEKIFGRSCESLYQHLNSFLEAVHPEDRAGVEQMLERQRAGEQKPFEYRIVRPDGSVRWILRRSFPIRDNDGQVLRLAGIGQDVTERKRVEAEVRQSEERYRDLVENSRELICVHDLDGLILSANRATLEVLGYDLREFCGKKNFRDLLAPEVRDQFDEYLDRIRRDGVATGLTLLQTSSGERRLLEYYNTVRTEGVSAPVVRAMGRDITEQKQAEKALRASEERYRDLVENSHELICTHALDGTILSANRAGLELLGYDPDEFIGQKNIRDILVPEARNQFNDYMDRILTEKATSGLMLVQTSSGERRVLEYYNSLRTEGVENPIVRGIARDITERRRAEDALRESEERYRELFENAKDAIYVHDLSGRYVSVNRAAEELSGYRREEIIGKHFSNFVAPINLKDVRKNLCRKLDDARETAYEVDIITRGRHRVPVEIVSRLIYENGVAVGIQGTARDITERKRAQEALRTFSQRVIDAQEAERQSIARELHDEIGQVLTAVRINLQTVQRSCQTDVCLPHVDESIAIVDEALKRVRELSLELRPSLLDELGLASALRWYVDRYAQRTGIVAQVVNGFEEKGRLPRDLETVCFRIAQEALTNVARHAQAKHVYVELRHRSRKLFLSIRDDGVGFDVARVTANGLSDSALGLRGMRERARAVSGVIEINSTLNAGTLVFASFPLNRGN